MGQLFYGSSERAIEVDDALLMHAQLVAFTKLRRGESFLISWKRPSGSGRETIWVHSSIPLRFVCESDEDVQLDARLLEELAQAAASTKGMDLSPDAVGRVTALPSRVRQAA